MTEQTNLIQLVPEGLTQGVTLPDAFLLIMREKDGLRHLPLLIDREGYELLRRAIMEQEFPETKLMLRLARKFDIRLLSVLVRCARTGGYYTSLSFQQPDADGGEPAMRVLDLEPAQGIAAALECGAPVNIDRADFDALYHRQGREGQVAIPISAMSGDLLKEALRQAVENEQFELASQLRDELKAREGSLPG